MTAYTRVFDVDPGSPNRSRSVEAEFDLVAAGFVTVEATLKRGYRAVTGADTVIASDFGKLLSCSGAFTLSFAAAATLGDGWFCIVRNTGTGAITLDPNGAETIDGLSTGVVYPSFAFLVACTGSAFHVQKLAGRRIEVLTSGTSWLCPMGIRGVNGRGVGSGGAGGKASGNPVSAAPGGPGGFAEWFFVSAPGTSYSYAIAAASAAQSAAGSPGANGSSTTFNTGVLTVTMTGGSGGVATLASQVTLGGLPTNGDMNMRAPPGFNAIGPSNTSVNVGGSTPLGSGGSFDTTAATVNAVSGYGGGGAGSSNVANSGASGAGCIVLEF